MTVVTRAELRAWVEAALAAVPLPNGAANALRTVADTTTTTRFAGAGRYQCPAEQAGVGSLTWMVAFDEVVSFALDASGRRADRHDLTVIE